MDTQGIYGFDVAVTRADDIDKKMLADVVCRKESGQTSSVLDLGCGGGGQSARLAVTGAVVLGVDVCDYADAYTVLRADYGLSQDVLKFIQGDMLQLQTVLGEQSFDMICFQRTLHYMPYKNAVGVLQELRARMNAGGKLYVSVTGLESDIGLQYEDATKLVERRFCRLPDADAETFHITEPVCLYTPEEFVVLLQESGWNIEECWISAFGNIKAICT